MSVNEGSIRASLALDLAAFQGQVDQALALSTKLGQGLTSIPTVKLQVDTAASQQAFSQYTASIEKLKAVQSGIPPVKPDVDTTAAVQLKRRLTGLSCA